MDLYDLGLGSGKIYRPGETVPPGRYSRVDRPNVIVTLDRLGYLPASLDGTVALYTQVCSITDLKTR